jgi:hypothetical protein
MEAYVGDKFKYMGMSIELIADGGLKLWTLKRT